MDLDQKIRVLGLFLLMSSSSCISLEGHCGKRHHEPSIQPQKKENDIKKYKKSADKQKYQKIKYTPPTDSLNLPAYSK